MKLVLAVDQPNALNQPSSYQALYQGTYYYSNGASALGTRLGHLDRAFSLCKSLLLRPSCMTIDSLLLSRAAYCPELPTV